MSRDSAARDLASASYQRCGEQPEFFSVPPSLYPPFVDSLIATVRQYDPDFTPEVEEAWRRTVDKGVQYMIARYDRHGSGG